MLLYQTIQILLTLIKKLRGQTVGRFRTLLKYYVTYDILAILLIQKAQRSSCWEGQDLTKETSLSEAFPSVMITMVPKMLG